MIIFVLKFNDAPSPIYIFIPHVLQIEINFFNFVISA